MLDEKRWNKWRKTLRPPQSQHDYYTAEPSHLCSEPRSHQTILTVILHLTWPSQHAGQIILQCEQARDRRAWHCGLTRCFQTCLILSASRSVKWYKTRRAWNLRAASTTDNQSLVTGTRWKREWTGGLTTTLAQADNLHHQDPKLCLFHTWGVTDLLKRTWKWWNGSVSPR